MYSRSSLTVYETAGFTQNQQRTDTNSYELRLKAIERGIVLAMKGTARVGAGGD